MKLAKKITIGLMLGTSATLIGWDVVVAANKDKGDTISEILIKTARKHPVISFAWGFLSGHLFWAQRVKNGDN